ncbi:MAG: hypothetical protein Kow00128_13150 [Deltaproteobacteria bacterium]
MKSIEEFRPGGTGVMATADAEGAVNVAIYAFPRKIDERTVAWGMTARRIRQHLEKNPNAAYLYREPGQGYRGFRLTLRLKEWQESGPLLEEVRENTRKVSGPAAADELRGVALFTVVETRPLL